MGIAEGALQRIRDRADLPEVARWYTELERRAGQWAGRCPLHEDRDPSFYVHPERGWHCFGCEKGGGDAIALVQAAEGLAFPEAARKLARHYGIEIEAGSDPSPAHRTAGGQPPPGHMPLHHERPDPNRRSAEDEKRLRELLREFRARLEDRRARRYIEGRGLEPRLLYELGCGYARPGQWPGRTCKAGRIVFPHTTPTGHLINLYGRAAGEVAPHLRHDHLPGPKGLFNGPAVRGGSEPLAICEAALDAASIIQVGHARTIAIYGKNPSSLPWDDLEDVEELLICFDADERGQDAAEDLATEATIRGYAAYILRPDDYGGTGDANEALRSNILSRETLSIPHPPS